MARYFKEKNLPKELSHFVKVEEKNGNADLLHVEDSITGFILWTETVKTDKQAPLYVRDKEEFSGTRKEVFDKNFKLINDKIKKIWKK